MKLKFYSIFDTKAKMYNTPFLLMNDSVAIRTCTTMVNDPNSQLAMHPEDYVLYFLGEFDDSNGSIIGAESEHRVLVKLNALVDPEQSKRILELRDIKKTEESAA
ncbi:nonstructural protein [Microviridae sp.]|nr:nonstructural protein [Microviridae sp.]